MTKIRVLIKIIILSCIYKLYYLFNTPLSQDELSYFRHSYLLLQGNIPFRNFGDISPPFFQLLLLPFFLIEKNPIYIIYTAKIFLLILSHVSLFYYYKIIKIFQGSENAFYATIMFSLSYIFFQNSLQVSHSNFSVPLLLLFSFLFFEKKINTKNKPLLLSIALFFISIDPRLILIIILLAIISLFMKKNYYIFYIFPLFVICFFLITFLYNFNVAEIILKIPMSYIRKSDQTILFTLQMWSGEWLIIISAIIGFYYLKVKNKTIILINVLLYFSLIFYILSHFRPHTFGIYTLPFIAFFSGIFVKMIALRMSVTFRNKYNYIFIYILVLFMFSNHSLFEKVKVIPHDLKLDEQKKIINLIYNEEKKGFLCMNLSRFAFNIKSKLTYPLLRFFEDADNIIIKFKVNYYIQNSIKKRLETIKPHFIIFSEDDHFLRKDLIDYIFLNYKKKFEYLYIKKESDLKENTYNLDEMNEYFYNDGFRYIKKIFREN